MSLGKVLVLVIAPIIVAFLNTALGVHIEPWWKDLIHNLYVMAWGIVLWNA